MACDTLMFESTIDSGMLVFTEVTRERVHAQVVEEHTQNRDAPDSVLVCERKRIVDGTDNRFWMCLEVFVQRLC